MKKILILKTCTKCGVKFKDQNNGIKICHECEAEEILEEVRDLKE